jgi:hypothetical protein
VEWGLSTTQGQTSQNRVKAARLQSGREIRVIGFGSLEEETCCKWTRQTCSGKGRLLYLTEWQSCCWVERVQYTRASGSQLCFTEHPIRRFVGLKCGAITALSTRNEGLLPGPTCQLDGPGDIKPTSRGTSGTSQMHVASLHDILTCVRTSKRVQLSCRRLDYTSRALLYMYVE